jgi:hypothetical protein
MTFAASDTRIPKPSLEGLAIRFSAPVPMSEIALPRVASVEGVPRGPDEVSSAVPPGRSAASRHILIPVATIAGLRVPWWASHV